MTTSSRRRRGHESEAIVAAYLRDHGFPYAEATGSGRWGTAVTSTPGIDWEVKARRALNLTAVIQQQANRAVDGVIPVAVIRPDGYGPARIAEAPVARRDGGIM